MKLVIHIGIHKTGTSALQGFLHTNRERLRDRGIWYEPPEGHKNHTLRVFEFRPGETYSPDAFRARLNVAADEGCPVYLMSSEVFVQRPFDIEAFAHSIDGFETEVIAYLRAPDDFVVSAYNQTVRGKNARTIPLRDKIGPDPTYRRQLSNWMRSQWELTLAPYDRKQWPNGSIFLDFLSMLHVLPDGLDIEPRQDDENRSLPAPLIEVLRAANIVGIAGEQRVSLIRELRELGRSRPDLYPEAELLTAAERRAYRAIFAEHVEAYRPFYRPGFDETFLLPS
ncbi:hypothetical protein [Mangrovicella endophytica]|uniref:hypothetical protein n=1 Tax=Mangrovicella endophytica TaxID=2066697 RepID=UPI0012FFD770|nr:hypothetical protein [Mangrovicella endophytica]